MIDMPSTQPNQPTFTNKLGLVKVPNSLHYKILRRIIHGKIIKKQLAQTLLSYIYVNKAAVAK